MRAGGDASTPYGINSMINFAIGLIFLGGGTLRLKNSLDSIPPLLLTVLPRFPSSVHDNKSTLQILRHFYSLVVEPRNQPILDSITNRQVREVDPAIHYPPAGSGGWVQRRDRGNAYLQGDAGELRKLLGFPLSTDSEDHSEDYFWSSPGGIPLRWIAQSTELRGAGPLAFSQDEQLTSADLAALTLIPDIKQKLRKVGETVADLGLGENELSDFERLATILAETCDDGERGEERELLFEICKNDKFEFYFDSIESINRKLVK